jgi:hypothetical protein
MDCGCLNGLGNALEEVRVKGVIGFNGINVFLVVLRVDGRVAVT